MLETGETSAFEQARCWSSRPFDVDTSVSCTRNRLGYDAAFTAPAWHIEGVSHGAGLA